MANAVVSLTVSYNSKWCYINVSLLKCFSFDSLANLATTKKVVSEVRSIYGKKKWTKAIIRSKCLFTENVLFFASFFFLTYFAKNTYSSKLAEKRLGRTTVNQKSIRERVLLFSNFSINLTDSPFYYKLPFNILFYYFMEIKTSKISGHSWHRRRNNIKA